jgi:signal-transduction protein with cAMP-binding, CBS, and nucleotidyltransferase domain
MFAAAPSVEEPSRRQLGEVLARELVASCRGTPLRRTAKLMAEADTGSIVILDDREAALGILTDSGLRRRGVARARAICAGRLGDEQPRAHRSAVNPLIRRQPSNSKRSA